MPLIPAFEVGIRNTKILINFVTHPPDPLPLDIDEGKGELFLRGGCTPLPLSPIL